MTARAATLEDYHWLYDHGYMPDGLKCAREIMLDIVERCPASFLDFGCGRGHLVDWINDKTKGEAFGTDRGIGRDDPWIGMRDWLISCDVFEHLTPAELDKVLKESQAAIRRGMLLTIANMSDVHAVAGERVELHLIQQSPSWWISRIRQDFPAAIITHRRIDSQRFALIVEF